MPKQKLKNHLLICHLVFTTFSYKYWKNEIQLTQILRYFKTLEKHCMKKKQKN